MKIIYNIFYHILFLAENAKSNKQHMVGSDIDTNGDRENKSENKTDSQKREDLLTKLKSLAITEEEDDNFDSDSDVESTDSSSNNDID